MNVPQLLHKLRVIANIEIVVPLLPEMFRIANEADGWPSIRAKSLSRQTSPCDGWPIQARFWLEWGSSKQAGVPGLHAFRSLGWKQTPRYSLLQRLQRIGQRILLRFTEQEVNMLWHDDVPINLKPEAAPHALQG